MVVGSNFITRGSTAYDRLMGRWSLRLAPLFIEFAGVMPGEHIVDVGCGTGNLAGALLARNDLASIDALDYDADFVATAKARLPSIAERVIQGDACALPYQEAAFDRALAMLLLHFVNDAKTAALEMRRVVKPGGTIAACVWDHYGGMPAQRMFWDTACVIEPAIAEHWAAFAYRPTTGAGELCAAFEAAGLTKITETLLTIRMDFADFEDYWQPLISGHGRLDVLLAAHDQARIKSAVRAAYLSGRPDGPRSFASVAWAVRGIRDSRD